MIVLRAPYSKNFNSTFRGKHNCIIHTYTCLPIKFMVQKWTNRFSHEVDEIFKEIRQECKKETESFVYYLLTCRRSNNSIFKVLFLKWIGIWRGRRESNLFRWWCWKERSGRTQFATVTNRVVRSGGTTIVFYSPYPLMDIITVWWDPFKGMISWTNYNMEMVCSWKLLAKNTIA